MDDKRAYGMTFNSSGLSFPEDDDCTAVSLLAVFGCRQYNEILLCERVWADEAFGSLLCGVGGLEQVCGVGISKDYSSNVVMQRECLVYNPLELQFSNHMFLLRTLDLPDPRIRAETYQPHLGIIAEMLNSEGDVEEWSLWTCGAVEDKRWGKFSLTCFIHPSQRIWG